jgi:glycosyltransferase involved in cell wall biosynthesis
MSKFESGVLTGQQVTEVFDDAIARGYALPAVNVIGTNSVNAVLETAREVNSPVIIQFSNGGGAFFAGKGLGNGEQQASILGSVSGAHHIHTLAKAYGVPVIIHTFHGHVFHSYFGRIKTEIFKRIERSLAKKSTGIIAISEQQKKELAEIHKICPAHKIEVIPLGLDLTKFNTNKAENRAKLRAELHLSDHEIAIAIIGRLAPVKDHGFFLDVISEVAKKTEKNIKVFIVGDGSEREAIENQANQINATFQGLITFTSWIEDIAPFNHAMDIICLTSKNEGTPVSLIEAQAAGVPVISTNVGGVLDIVEQGKTGFVVEPNDLEAYASKLLELIEKSES